MRKHFVRLKETPDKDTSTLYETATEALLKADFFSCFGTSVLLYPFEEVSFEMDSEDHSRIKPDSCHIENSLGYADMIRWAVNEEHMVPGINGIYGYRNHEAIQSNPCHMDILVNTGRHCSILGGIKGRLYNSGDGCHIMSNDSLIVSAANKCTVFSERSNMIVCGHANTVISSGDESVVYVLGAENKIQAEGTGRFYIDDPSAFVSIPPWAEPVIKAVQGCILHYDDNGLHVVTEEEAGRWMKVTYAGCRLLAEQNDALVIGSGNTGSGKCLTVRECIELLQRVEDKDLPVTVRISQPEKHEHADCGCIQVVAVDTGVQGSVSFRC